MSGQLLLVLRVDKLAIEAVHDREFTKLGPEEVDLLGLLFFIEKPPEAILKQGPNHHLIVAFANIASILRGMLLGRLVDGQVSLQRLNVLHCVLADLLLE